jgi:diguanylate cyclase (GGDEF)-like protein
MMHLVWALLVVLAASLGFRFGRRRKKPSRWVPGPNDPAHRVLPDPGLRWLGRSHDADAAWAFEGSSTSPTLLARYVATGVARKLDLLTLEKKLGALAADQAEGVERLDQGTLLYTGRPGALGALLLPQGRDAGQVEAAMIDLRNLADALVFHHALLPTRETQSPVESLESVTLGLAVQLERLAHAPAAVIMNLQGGSQVLAVSPQGDQRRKNTWIEGESPAMKILRGEDTVLVTSLDPLGTTVADRRRSTSAQVIGIGPDGARLGAVVLWLSQGSPLQPQAFLDVSEAIRAMENALSTSRVVHELRQTATTDPLTGLKNRRGFEAEMVRVGTERGALIYADLDRFKQLNDALGHPAGDAALVHFANIIREHIRNSDTAARIGGEEFAVWLPEASAATGREIADRIRLALGDRMWLWQESQWPLAASFGVAACPETSKSRQNLPAQADAALYKAKNAGRNRVVMANS